MNFYFNPHWKMKMSNSIGIGYRNMSNSIGFRKTKMSRSIGIEKRNQKSYYTYYIKIFLRGKVTLTVHKKIWLLDLTHFAQAKNHLKYTFKASVFKDKNGSKGPAFFL